MRRAPGRWWAAAFLFLCGDLVTKQLLVGQVYRSGEGELLGEWLGPAGKGPRGRPLRLRGLDLRELPVPEGARRFVARGTLRFPRGGEYRFSLRGNCPAELYVGQLQVAEDCGGLPRGGGKAAGPTVTFPTGGTLEAPIRLDALAPGAGLTLAVLWSGPGFEERPLPGRALRHDPLLPITREEAAGATVIPRVLAFRPSINLGAAFGLFHGWTYVLILVSVAATLYIVYLQQAGKFQEDSWYVRVGMMLFLAGAVGNLVDRVCFGAVRDFIALLPKLPLYGKPWPIFNLADAYLCVGVALWVIPGLRHRPTTREAGAGCEADAEGKAGAANPEKTGERPSR